MWTVGLCRWGQNKLGEAMGKVAVEDVRIDPLVIDMPNMTAKFVRFEASKNGQHFYVVYEIVPEKP